MSPHSWWKERCETASMLWGPMAVTAIAHIEKRGYVLFVETEARERPLEVYVSEKGRNIRVWRDGRELR